MLVRRKARMIGYNLRHPGMLATVLDGMVEEKNWKGRPRQSYEDQILKDTGCKSFVEMKRLAQKREEWRDATY
ncbi:hypothetical protein PGB90_003881 [Kerria lacca]